MIIDLLKEGIATKYVPVGQGCFPVSSFQEAADMVSKETNVADWKVRYSDMMLIISYKD